MSTTDIDRPNIEAPTEAMDTNQPAEPKPSLITRLFSTSLEGASWGVKALYLLAKGVMVLWFLLVNPTYLLNLWSIRRFKKTQDKLIIYLQTKLMVCWPIVSCSFLFYYLSHLGLSTVSLGYLYLLVIVYCIYTATEDMSWTGAIFVTFLVGSIIAIVLLLGEIYKTEVFSVVMSYLKRTGIEFPGRWACGLGLILGLMYAWKFIRRLTEHQIVYSGNSMVVRFGWGEGERDYQRTDHIVVAVKPDENERRLGYGRIRLESKNGNLPSYMFETVSCAALLFPLIQQLTGTTEVEVRVNKEDLHA